jgi:hypothetical protein
VRRPLARLLAALPALGSLRRRRAGPDHAPDPRAEELRQKLDESRSIAGDRDEFEGGEVTVDRAQPAPEDPASRRRTVHEGARETVEQMRRGR